MGRNGKRNACDLRIFGEGDSMPRRFRFTPEVFVVVTLVLAVIVCFACLVQWALQDKYELARLRLGQGREVVISADSSWEHSQGVYYSIVDQGRPIRREVSLTRVLGGSPRPRFEVATAESGNLAGVVACYDDEKRLLAIHDFQTGESWSAEDDGPARAKRNELVERLCRENPDLPRP
jgi:hypothetical protein